jgi:hypothetical protein
MFESLISKDVLLIAVIVFSIMTIIRFVVRGFWDNNIFQRIVILFPIIIGGLLGMVWKFSDSSVVGYGNKIGFGILGAMFSMVFYSFLKGVMGGKDFFEVVSDFMNNKTVSNNTPIEIKQDTKTETKEEIKEETKTTNDSSGNGSGT